MMLRQWPVVCFTMLALIFSKMVANNRIMGLKMLKTEQKPIGAIAFLLVGKL